MEALIMILPIGAMLFFMQRTQKKQKQERQKLMESISIGSRVITIGGLHGIISEAKKKKNTVVLDCEGIYLEFERTSIRTVKPATIIENDDSVTEIIVEEETEEKEAE